MQTQQKKIVIAAVAALFVIPIIAALLYVIFSTPQKTPTITQTTDPITGEEMIDAGTSPENLDSNGNSIKQVVVTGATNIADLYGNDDVYIALRDRYIVKEFSSHKSAKISKDNISKEINTDESTGTTKIVVNFWIYIDDSKTDVYKFNTIYDQESGIVTVNMTKPSGETQTDQLNIAGGD